MSAERENDLIIFNPFALSLSKGEWIENNGSRGVSWYLLALLLIVTFCNPTWATESMPPLVAGGEKLGTVKQVLEMLHTQGPVHAVALSADGRYLATGSDDKTARLWEVASGKELRRFEGHTDRVTSVSFSVDGRYLITGSDDKTARLWEVSSGKELRRFEGHASGISSVSFSADGGYLATGSYDKTARLWEVASGKELRRFEGHTSGISSVSFSVDGHYLITGSWDKTARLWKVASGKELRRFGGHTDQVTSVSFSADGRYLITSSWDKTARLWEVASGKELRRFEGNTGSVSSASFSTDGRYLITGSWDKTARLWEVATGKELRRFEGHTDRVTSVSFSVDGRYLITGSWDKTARLWEVASGKELHRFEGQSSGIFSVSFSADGRYLATDSSDDKTARLWEVASGKELRRFEGQSSGVYSVSFSANGRYLATGSSDKTVRLWEVASGKELRRFEGHTEGINSVSFSADGRYLATGSYDKTARLWELASGKELRRFEGHSGGISSVSFSTDGRYLATGSLDKTARLWEVASGKALRLFEGHSGGISSVNFSADGGYLATGSYDKTARLWEVASGKELRRFEGHTGGIDSVSLSLDGRYLSTGSDDKTARLWEVASGKELRSIKVNTGWVTSVSFSADGRYLAIGSMESNAWLWEVASGKVLALYQGGKGGQWLSCRMTDNLCLRADDGTLLHRLNPDNYSLEAILPPIPEQPGQLVVEPLPQQLAAADGEVGKFTIKIRNTGKGKLYWLAVEQVYDHESSVSFYPPQRLQSLDGGASVELEAGVSFPSAMLNPPASAATTLHLRVSDAFGQPQDFHIPVQGQSPSLQLSPAKFIRAAGQLSLQLTLTNVGQSQLHQASAVLNIKGLDNLPEQTIVGIQAGASQSLSFALPEGFSPDDATRFDLSINQLNKDHPLHVWEFKDQTAALPAPAWLLYGAILLALGGAIYYQRNYRHPLLRKLQADAALLSRLPLQTLLGLLPVLRRTRQLERLLQAANVHRSHFDLALAFAQADAAQRAKLLGGRLYLAPENCNDRRLFCLTLGDHFPLNIEKLYLFFPAAGKPAQEALNELRNHPEAANKVCLLLADDEAVQAQLHDLAQDRSNLLVAPTAIEITELLLAADPQAVLAGILAAQLALTHISPYQTGGGARKQSIFFGRSHLIAQIMNREPANYLLVGGRQLGKSSLLKELDRRYADIAQMQCRYLTLSSDNLTKPWARSLGLPTETTLAKIVDFIGAQATPFLFLVDEADTFVAAEAGRNYATLQTLRALSEEGRAFFILAGFWALYSNVAFDYHSPLKNFGEVLNLGALEPEACRALATTPMRTMRLEYEPAALQRLLDATGGRPNLISIACARIIAEIGAESRTITREMVERSLASEAIKMALAGWDELAGDDAATRRLARIVVFGTLAGPPFSQAEIMQALNTWQVAFEPVQLERLLKRLELAFVLGNDGGRYAYRVPLFVEQLKTGGEIEIRLLNEIKSSGGKI